MNSVNLFSVDHKWAWSGAAGFSDDALKYGKIVSNNAMHNVILNLRGYRSGTYRVGY